MDAVKQWKYKPYFAEWRTVEVETQVEVNSRCPEARLLPMIE